MMVLPLQAHFSQPPFMSTETAPLLSLLWWIAHRQSWSIDEVCKFLISDGLGGVTPLFDSSCVQQPGNCIFFSCSSPKLLVGHQCKSTKVASQRRHTWHTSYWALHTLPVPVHCLAWWLTLPIGNWIFGNIFLYKRRMSSMYMIDRINLASQDHETPNHLPWPRCRTLDHWLSDPSLGWETEPSHHNQQRISINSINIAAICQVAVKKNMCFLLNKDWVKLLRSLAKVLET